MFSVETASGQYGEPWNTVFGWPFSISQNLPDYSIAPSVSSKRKAPWQVPDVGCAQVWRIEGKKARLAPIPLPTSTTTGKISSQDEISFTESESVSISDALKGGCISSPLHIQSAPDEVVVEADADDLQLLHLLARTCESEPLSPASCTTELSCDGEDDDQTPRSFVPMQSHSGSSSICGSDSDLESVEGETVRRNLNQVRRKHEERIRFSWDEAIEEAKKAAACKP